MIAAALVLSVLIASGAAVAIVYRRQRSVDEKTSRKVSDKEALLRLTEQYKWVYDEHMKLREEFDRVKLLVPRPQGR